jgi:ubiquinone/menaquinone biosynthesis C-methylase UbiE
MIKKELSQKEIWNKIAMPWKSFRTKPIKEVSEFLYKQKGKVLDIGCGSGRNFIKKSDLIFYGVDFSDKMIKHAKSFAKKEGINFKPFLSTINDLPFKDNFFDSAIYVSALHCIETENNRKKSLEELYRVLKPKAKAMISVWNKDQERFKKDPKDILIPWKHEGKEYMRYYHLYEKKELTHLLKEVGFEITEIYDKKREGFFSEKNITAVVQKN